MSGPAPIALANASNADSLFSLQLGLAEPTPTFCQSLAAEFPVGDPFGTRYSVPADFAPWPEIGRGGALSLFQETSPFARPGSDRSLPDDILNVPAEDLDRLARDGYESDLQDQVERLLRDFTACSIHGLAANYGRLPRFLQDVWVDYAQDPDVGFRIDYTTDPVSGRPVPQITFVRMNPEPRAVLRIDDRPSADRSNRVSPVSIDIEAAPVAAAGLFVGRTLTPSGQEPAGGRGPGLLGSNPVLGTAVTVGGGTLIYVLVDRHVASLDIPQGVRGLVATAETGLIYEGLGRFGLIERPQWGHVVRAAPHLALLQLGTSHLFDAFGMPRGSPGNNIASFAVSTGAYVGLPRLAPRFPRLANLYRTSIGLPGAAGATAFRGSSLVSGGLRFAGVVGTVFLVDWLGGSLGEFMIWAGDGFTSPSPDDRLWRTAVESVYADFANNTGGVSGWVARNLSVISKSGLGWARFFSGSFDRDFCNSVRDVIDRWVNGTNDVAQAIDNGLVLAALQSMDRAPEGGLRFNREAFQLNVSALYESNRDVVTAGYRMEALLSGTRRAPEVANASGITRLIGEYGYVRDQAGVESLLTQLFTGYHGSQRLRSMIEDLASAERRAFEDRLGELNLLDGQTGRPRRTGQLNDEQRRFLHGDGQTSEAAVRRRRLDHYTDLLRRVDAGERLWDGVAR